VSLGALEVYEVPPPLVAPVMLLVLYLQTRTQVIHIN